MVEIEAVFSKYAEVSVCCHCCEFKDQFWCLFFVAWCVQYLFYEFHDVGWPPYVIYSIRIMAIQGGWFHLAIPILILRGICGDIHICDNICDCGWIFGWIILPR